MLFQKIQSTLRYIPETFFCAGCNLPTWKTICQDCQRSITYNQKIMPSPIHELKGLAPLVYSFERTQSLIRRWKETGGTDLRKSIFKLSHPLKNELLNLHFFAIVPIPQDPQRSIERGQASALEVARFFSESLDLPLLTLLELNSVHTKRLTGLSRFNRESAPNPFRISHEFPRNDLLSRRLEEKVDLGCEIKLLLVDDLITSGSTITKASETLLEFLPRARIWAGSLGFRPLTTKSSHAQASR